MLKTENNLKLRLNGVIIFVVAVAGISSVMALGATIEILEIAKRRLSDKVFRDRAV